MTGRQPHDLVFGQYDRDTARVQHTQYDDRHGPAELVRHWSVRHHRLGFCRSISICAPTPRAATAARASSRPAGAQREKQLPEQRERRYRFGLGLRLRLRFGQSKLLFKLLIILELCTQKMSAVPPPMLPPGPRSLSPPVASPSRRGAPPPEPRRTRTTASLLATTAGCRERRRGQVASRDLSVRRRLEGPPHGRTEEVTTCPSPPADALADWTATIVATDITQAVRSTDRAASARDRANGHVVFATAR